MQTDIKLLLLQMHEQENAYLPSRHIVVLPALCLLLSPTMPAFPTFFMFLLTTTYLVNNFLGMNY